MVPRQQNQQANGKEVSENTVTAIVGEVQGFFLVYFLASFGNILKHGESEKNGARLGSLDKLVPF